MSQFDFEKILKELEWSFSKSSGPGGQHVNTTDSKAKLTWAFVKSEALKARQINQIKKNLDNYLNKSQTCIHFSCSSSRSKERNKQDCIKKLKSLLETKAFVEPKKRIKTRPSRSSVRKRLDSKTKHSQTKQNRQKVKY
jgi:ribosome-associated protein